MSCMPSSIVREGMMHTTVVILETDRAENLDAFLVQSHLNQWDRLHIMPSIPIEEGMKDVAEGSSLF